MTMILFLACAIAMTLVALAFAILPLLRTSTANRGGQECLAVLADGLRELDAQRDAGRLSDDDYRSSRGDLERQALASEQTLPGELQPNGRVNWATALAIAVMLPLTVVPLYLVVGQPVAPASAPSLAGPHAGIGQARMSGGEPARMDGVVQALSQRLANDDSDGEGWTLLARSHLAANRLSEAIAAYRKATTIVPDNPDLLVEYANTLAMANQRSLAGAPSGIIERALAIDPDNWNALALGGAAALQASDRPLALRRWQHLERLLEPGSDDRTRLEMLIARAQSAPVRQVATEPPQPSSQPPSPPSLTSASPHPSETARAIDGTVTIAGDLAGKVARTDTLYVLARAVDGPPMPIAAVRLRADAWPASFRLDDSSAMAAGRALSSFPRVNLVARISRLGSPTAQPGDIEGRIENVTPGSNDVRIVMDRIVGR